jgi:hypothetical protein
VAAGDPFVRLFSQAPAVAPARKVTTKLSIVNVSIMDKKTKPREKGSCPAFSAGGGIFLISGTTPALVVFKNLVGASASLQLGRSDQPRVESFPSRAVLFHFPTL